MLGGACLGAPLSLVDWPEQRLVAPLPGCSALALREVWLAEGDCLSGHSEGIAWRRQGELLYGVLALEESWFADGDVPPLQAAAESAYRRIFRLLDAQQLPHLWRVWNYLADINLETHGLERYRQFNIGRQDAFLAGCRDSTGNVPAACALGLAGGPLSIAFLAGRLPAVPVENPRQISAYHYPADYGPRSPTFSRGALVYPAGQEILFVSGTASIVGHQTVHIGDVAAQCREAMVNIAAVFAEANRLRRSGEFSLSEASYRVYLRAAEDLPAIQPVLRELMGDAPCIVIQADVCRADLLVEIEAQVLHVLEEA